jgi:hypothetical protein
MIKCNHGCAYNFAWHPGSTDFTEVLALTRQWMTSTYGTTNYEWGYTQVAPRVFLEQFIESRHREGLLDIAVRASAGRPLLASITTRSKTPEETMDYLDCHGMHVRFGDAEPGFGTRFDDRAGLLLQPDLLPPALFREAVDAAAELSRGFDYGRFDFLSDGKTLYAGEITVYPASGLSPMDDKGMDPWINPYWDLRKSGFLSQRQRGWRRLYAWLLQSAL